MLTETETLAAAEAADKWRVPEGSRWTVLAVAKHQAGHTFWRVLCDPAKGGCGAEKIVEASGIKSGRSKSCGCLWRERHIERCTIHGGFGKPEYSIWVGINQRCTNWNRDGHRDYVGRGIRVCQRWRESFANFYEDMGPRPTATHEIDRKDNDGHYSCGHCAECLVNGWTSNCRWATRKEQIRNTRQNRLLTFNGKTQCLVAWAEELGFGIEVLRSRVRRDWSDERALTTPVAKKRIARRLRALLPAGEGVTDG